ncbi:MAG: hypothetical protein K2O45_02535 [Oscillospiraceae bacterium]|nr:hypothetical protein [Oscillospiraceae bacterium]
MKRWILLLAALLLLNGCGNSASPTEPEPINEPTPPPTAQDVVQWLTDPSHFLFYVNHWPNGHIITTERTEEGLTLTVWAEDDLSAPVQTILMEDCEDFDQMVSVRGDAYEPNSEALVTVQDFNFDGQDDFGFCYSRGMQPQFFHVWLWDEATGQYQAEPAFDELPSPYVDWVDEKIECYIRGGAAGAQGDHSFYQWIDGVLTEVRHIKLDFEDWEDMNSHYVSVTDRINGEMQEVFRYEGNDWFDIADRWSSLGYTGE